MNQCVLCERNSEEVPLIAFEYKGEDYFVCTGHLPTLLHKPEMFEGKLKNVGQGWSEGEGHHHHD
jgi:hypothetical protein